MGKILPLPPYFPTPTTVAKGSVGEDTPNYLPEEPQGELCLDHSLEGLKNKETHAIKK